MFLANNSANSKLVKNKNKKIIIYSLLLCAASDQHVVVFFTSWLKPGPSENPAATEQAEKRGGGEKHSGEYRRKDKTVLSADRRN